MTDRQSGQLRRLEALDFSRVRLHNGSVKSITASSVKNDTADMAQPTQEITRTTAETLTSTVSHSSSYSFTEGLKLSAATELLGAIR